MPWGLSNYESATPVKAFQRLAPTYATPGGRLACLRAAACLLICKALSNMWAREDCRYAQPASLDTTARRVDHHLTAYDLKGSSVFTYQGTINYVQGCFSQIFSWLD